MVKKEEPMDADEFIERQIVIGCIVSDEFAKFMHKNYNKRFLASQTARHLVKWSLEYYDTYKKAPNTNIDGIYLQHADRLGEDQALDIEDILNDLSDEYEKTNFNFPYLIDKTIKYFKKQYLLNMSKDIEGALAKGDLTEAEQLAKGYTEPVQDVLQIGIDPFEDEDAIERAFGEQSLPLFTFPKDLGDFLNDQLTRDSFVVLQAPEKRGKCIAKDEKVLLDDGRYLSIEEVYKNKVENIICFNETSRRFQKAKISHFYDNGVKDVYEVTTRTGRRVKTTLNHPFLTLDGWKDLGDINEGDFIGVPRKLDFFGGKHLDDHKVKLLAYILAEGCTRHNAVTFTSTYKEIQEEFEYIVAKFGCSCNWLYKNDKKFTARIYNGKSDRYKQGVNNIKNFLHDFGIMGKLSKEKNIPQIIFQLGKGGLITFLSTLFTCDGWVNKNGKEIGYATTNETFARQVQSLLTRFGIVSKLNFKNNDKSGIWSVLIRDSENVLKFIKEINFRFHKKRIVDSLQIEVDYKSFLDKVPPQLSKKVINDARKELGVNKSGGAINRGVSNFYKVCTGSKTIQESIRKNKPAMRKSFICIKHIEATKPIFDTDLMWDEVMCIRYIGKEQTYDITVPEHHNFVCENMLVHNTFFLMEMAFRGLKNNNNVAFFQAGDMSQDQFIRRMGVYLCRKSDKEKFCASGYAPVLDCAENQNDACTRPERENHVGLTDYSDWKKSFDDGTIIKGTYSYTKEKLLELMEDAEDYTPCRNCKHIKPCVYFKNVKEKSILTKKEAKLAFKKFRNKHPKRFKLATYANNTLSIAEIQRALETWENQENFVPDVIVIDYADILIPHNFRQDQRHQVNEIWKDLRSLSQEKHCLLVTATQASSSSYTKRTITLDDFSEDKRKYSHVTAMYGMNQTDEEKQIGILRLNEIVKRDGDFSPMNQVAVLQRLAEGRPVLGSYKHKELKENKKKDRK